MKYLLLAIFFLFIYGSYSTPGDYCCDSPNCNPMTACSVGESCCIMRPVWMEYLGGTCYNPSVQSCSNCPVYNPNHPQQSLCPKETPTCCNGCIDSNSKCCHNYGSYDAWSCPSDHTCCGFSTSNFSCCDPSTHECRDNKCVLYSSSNVSIVSISFPTIVDVSTPENWTITIVLSNDDIVNNVYVTSTLYVNGGGSEGFFVISNKIAENTFSAMMDYDNTLKYLAGADLSIAIRIQLLNSNEQEYSTQALAQLGFSTNYSIVNNSRLFSDQQCGGASCTGYDKCCMDYTGRSFCYNTTTHFCVPYKGICSIGNNLCGNNMCFSNNNYVCYGKSICRVGFQKCGDACYDPSSYYCINDNLVQRTGAVQCNSSTCSSPLLCCNNSTCYNGNTQVCSPAPYNFRAPQVVCPIINGIAQQACGFDCYDPNNSYCCVISSPGGSSTRICDASTTKPKCCGIRGYVIPAY